MNEEINLRRDFIRRLSLSVTAIAVGNFGFSPPSTYAQVVNMNEGKSKKNLNKEMNRDKKNWRVVVPHTCSLGEGPVWDISNKLLYWVDILENEIHWFSPVQGAYHTFWSGDFGRSLYNIGQNPA